MCEGVLLAGLLVGVMIGMLVAYGALTMRHPFFAANAELQRRIEELESLLRKK